MISFLMLEISLKGLNLPICNKHAINIIIQTSLKLSVCFYVILISYYDLYVFMIYSRNRSC